jgi:hypothetical protein
MISKMCPSAIHQKKPPSLPDTLLNPYYYISSLLSRCTLASDPQCIADAASVVSISRACQGKVIPAVVTGSKVRKNVTTGWKVRENVFRLSKALSWIDYPTGC